MIRQIAAHYQEASMTVLEERVHHLEAKVATLSEALRVLAHGLEGGPLAEPGQPDVVDAARRAYEILLAADLVSASAEGAPSSGGTRPAPEGSRASGAGD